MFPQIGLLPTQADSATTRKIDEGQPGHGLARSDGQFTNYVSDGIGLRLRPSASVPKSCARY